MLIRVEYADGRFDLVKPFLLENLLADNRIRKFVRNGQWVTVGRDPVRRGRLTSYAGVDRRKLENRRSVQ